MSEELRFVVARLRASDIEPLTELVVAAQADSDQRPRPAEAIRAAIAFDVEHHGLLVAAYDDDVLAAALFGSEPARMYSEFALDARTFFFTELSVHPRYRRRGLSRALMQMLGRELLAHSYRYALGHIPAGTRHEQMMQQWATLRDGANGKPEYLFELERIVSD
ncbi:MAG TPA: GNAT family N-acetyltransferase [Thermoanaerobaculia bacterium]